MSEVDVSVILVTYNSAGILGQCLSALPTDQRYELIIIDNLSSDNSLELAKRTRPDALIIANNANVGFAAAVNTAAAHATGRYILLLNPDAVITRDELAGVVATADANADAAAVAPLVTDSQGLFATVAAGHFPTLWRMFTHMSGLSRLARWARVLEGHYLLRRQIPPGQLLSVDWVSGGCMLIRGTVWRSLDGLSERWFMYAEDIEFCLRARRAGYRILLDSKHFATHEIGGSSSNVDGRLGTLWLTNLYDLYQWQIASTKASASVWRFIVVFGFSSRALASRVLSRPSGHHGAQRRFRAYARALSSRRSSDTQ